ncbi:hypothetical protein NEOLI_001225 [Neolecta irregularis DAH-3]|uniref:Karyogamy protein n=1 Tax=Neolecta irregularis (strain DAH-3) TaxID=1198029 RepID=A0A1U7LSA6_NEOID|nr:hypothetical protein NEOLI_001225 [Neolecta irregularis DAH-3]|eukprot:OLL25401.1 hypothetical protein NEOLI_001225 [Neolecta irregularis DAH-3]
MELSLGRLTRSSSLMSVTSLARQSFSTQLSRLTSLSLPSTEYLRSKISSLQTPEAIVSLRASGQDILKWITVAQAVLSGLDAEDDVEWAASGKDSLGKVELAVTNFGEIIKTFIELSDEVSSRDDPNPTSLAELVRGIDSITDAWAKVKSTLDNVKEQVEISLEWVESMQIINDITTELDECQTIAFEIEEERHKAPKVLGEEGVCQEKPSLPNWGHRRSNTFDESNMSMVKLDGRMQPLRASLDFLKPRLVSFAKRADLAFPSAILELNEKRNHLENQWNKLKSNYTSLKKELEDDHWVASFKSTAAQANHMMDSIERSLRRVQSYLLTGASKDAEKCVKTYYAKRSGYGPPIERVLTMFESHLQSRGTLNGVILRTKSVIQNRWAELSKEMDLLEHQVDSTFSDGISSISLNDISDSGSTAPSEPSRAITPKRMSNALPPSVLPQMKSPTRIPLSTKRISLAPQHALNTPARNNRAVSPIPPRTLRRLTSFSSMGKITPPKPLWNSSIKADDVFTTFLPSPVHSPSSQTFHARISSNPPCTNHFNGSAKSSDGLKSIDEVINRRASSIPRPLSDILRVSRPRRESAMHIPACIKSPLSESGANGRPKPAWR